jgi:hypothetical protein
MPPAQPRFEEVAGQRLPLGGRNGYLGVRAAGRGAKATSSRGRRRARKQHRTRLCHSAQEAAIALAQVKEDLELGMFEERGKKKAQPAATIATSTKKEAGVYLGRLLQLPRADVLCVRAVLLSEQQAAAAAARGVAVAYADAPP